MSPFTSPLFCLVLAACAAAIAATLYASERDDTLTGLGFILALFTMMGGAAMAVVTFTNP